MAQLSSSIYRYSRVCTYCKYLWVYLAQGDDAFPNMKMECGSWWKLKLIETCGFLYLVFRLIQHLSASKDQKLSRRLLKDNVLYQIWMKLTLGKNRKTSTHLFTDLKWTLLEYIMPIQTCNRYWMQGKLSKMEFRIHNLNKAHFKLTFSWVSLKYLSQSYKIITEE